MVVERQAIGIGLLEVGTGLLDRTAICWARKSHGHWVDGDLRHGIGAVSTLYSQLINPSYSQLLPNQSQLLPNQSQINPN
eukprot:SAG31_NODE_2767_length_5122_cov_7.978101_3_plen_80_part_00